MSFNLRQGMPSDLPYIYEICHVTGYNGTSAEGLIQDRYMLGHYFAGPYLLRDPGWTWIVTKDEYPVGYLVATPDSVPFFDWMEKDWVPQIRPRYAKLGSKVGRRALSDFENKIADIIHGKAQAPAMVAEYPAHLHIDLLPDAQGQGMGAKLIQAFKNKLTAHNVPGFHLGVGEGNAKVVPFYAKQGIRELSRQPGVIYMGWKT